MDSEAVRVRQSASATTAPAVLAGFACDPSVTVRASLALNAAAPDAANSMLARDPDTRVRELLARKLGSLLPTLSHADREALRHRTWALLTRLAADEADRVRAVIAAEVKGLPDAPRDVILRLAHDPTITVCEPVILFSPLLSAADLVALVTSAPNPATREAVARRSNLPETVSDAIADSADNEAIRALLANQSAQIREATLDALVARAGEQESWHEPLTRRPTLSAQAMRLLSDIVADHLLEVLSTRTDIPDQLRQRVRERLAGAIAEPAEQHSPEELLLMAERAGDTAAAIRTLAERADVAVELVEQAATLRSTKGLVALTWKAGLPMRVAMAMQTLLARVSPAAAIQPGPGDSFPLTVEEMKWQLTFLAGAAHAEATPAMTPPHPGGKPVGKPVRTPPIAGRGASQAEQPEVQHGAAAPAVSGQAWFTGGSGSRVQTR